MSSNEAFQLPEGYTLEAGNEASRDDMAAAGAIAEAYFKTEDDPEQTPINDESGQWLLQRLPECFTIVKFRGAVVGGGLFLPAPEGLLRKFANGTINERELFEAVSQLETNPWDGLYLCTGYLTAEHRDRGIGFVAAITMLHRLLRLHPQIRLTCYWAYNPAAKNFFAKGEAYLRKIGLTVLERRVA